MNLYLEKDDLVESKDLFEKELVLNIINPTKVPSETREGDWDRDALTHFNE